MRFRTTKVSRNVKTGPMPVMTSSSDTCPDSCPLKAKGCYAKTGPLALHWGNVDKGERGSTLEDALKPIRKLNRGALWRYGQAGDLPGVGDEIDRKGLQQIARANRGKRAIVFTHKPPTSDNLAALREAMDAGLNINLSADNVSDADELAKTGLPVVVVLPEKYARQKNETLHAYKYRIKDLDRRTPEGLPIAICPATYTETSCTECGVCAAPRNRNAVVGFPAHGTQRKHVSMLAEQLE